MFNKKFTLAIGIAAFLNIANFSSAQTANASPKDDNFKVSASVYAGCKIYSTQDIEFIYDPLKDTASSGSANFSFACVKGTTFTLRAVSQNSNGANKGYLIHDDGIEETYIIYALAVQLQYNNSSQIIYSQNIFDDRYYITLSSPTNSPPSVSFTIANATPGANVIPGTYSDYVTLYVDY